MNTYLYLSEINGAYRTLASSKRQGPDFEVGEFDAPDAVFSGKGKRENEYIKDEMVIIELK